MFSLLVILSHEVLAMQAMLVLLVIFPVMSILSILRNEFEQLDRYIWITLVILLPIIGSILYIFIGRERRLNRY
ncbi:PLDc N-terminal domain-containing protein [Gaoshiqia sp. Z1-71]|uniref:PLDc N-terminal domain-containing protein n=1 Tax=Gaoshiqia hydrogeniformans TaxID=3290090 RepID=UPI003BF88D5C